MDDELVNNIEFDEDLDERMGEGKGLSDVMDFVFGSDSDEDQDELYTIVEC